MNLASVDVWARGEASDNSDLPKDTTEAACREAIAYNCAACCSASPYWTPVVIEELAGAYLSGTQAVPQIIDPLDPMREIGLTPGGTHKG